MIGENYIIEKELVIREVVHVKYIGSLSSEKEEAVRKAIAVVSSYDNITVNRTKIHTLYDYTDDFMNYEVDVYCHYRKKIQADNIESAEETAKLFLYEESFYPKIIRIE